VTGPIPPLRTLIADESQSFSVVLERWIASRSDLVWIATVTTGPGAVEAARRLRPDLVLLDAILPGLDGFRVVRELTRLPQPPLTVIVTFQADDNARRAAFDAGADGFVAKDELAETMDLLIPELLEREEARLSPQGRSDRPGSRSERAP